MTYNYNQIVFTINHLDMKPKRILFGSKNNRNPIDMIYFRFRFLLLNLSGSVQFTIEWM